ncbi:uncharacterized protein N7484_006270 [Penicillium longicatenatum]|uniref:uncharacterized protein n=1 Tax=Penicillium longicatenatum TaxID=1561947 RepID=UPI002549A417|nr:uncharacterized protein N7484_006270 [Penicillium longicatenatum]KAJ5643763.1 hypothetical protein N7484_006270 [Penicillium longicatenatum]
MRRCLCPGGLLRTGRGSILSLRRVSPPSALQTRLSSAKCNIKPKEYDFLLTYNSLPPSPLPSWEKYNIESWIPLLEKCVPPAQKGEITPGKPEAGASLLDHAAILDRGHALKAFLYHARTEARLNLVNHLGFDLGQWSYVYRLLGTFVDTYEVLIPYMTPQRPTSCFAWKNTGLSLDQLSEAPHDDLIIKRELIPISSPSDNIPLAMLSGARPAAREFARTFLGEILVNLGSLVLEAADRPAAESELAMSCVYRILARLHHLDLISDRVYQSPDDKTNLSSLRPPGLHLLTGHIMSVLSDAAWLEHESALASAATEAGEEPPFVPFKVGVRELGHEIWLELILWCCVEHGFNKQGAWLVGQMCGRRSQSTWKIESWVPLMEALDLVQQTNISTERVWRRPGQENPVVTHRGSQKLPFNGLGLKTISSEVVSSLRNGLSNIAYNGVGFRGSAPSELLTFAKPLTALLDPPGAADELRPTRRITTENIVRIIESGCLKPNEDPVALERVLRSTQNLVPPWETEPVPSADDLNNMTRAQLYDQTAALTGLVQYNIKSYSNQRQATQAFTQYAWLQNIVDASKVHHIQAFFEHLNRSQSMDVPFFDAQQLNTSQLTQSSLPEVSLTTLADLLDLATAARADDFGNWLLFSEDIDGPSIPPAVYGTQVLAPSILRFAAATRNPDLSHSVIKSLELPLTVNTLRSMANLHIEFGDWDRAILAFEYLRDYRLKSWGFSNILALGAKIVRLDGALKLRQASGVEDTAQKSLRQSLDRAKHLLYRFFSGEFNTPRSKLPRTNTFQWKALERTRAIFRKVPGELGVLAGQIQLNRTISSRERLPYVPTVSFHVLLSAILDVHGCKVGHEFAVRWLQKTPNPQKWRQREGGVSRFYLHAERDWQLGNPSYKHAWHNHSMSKAVIPDLNTIRILVRAAMRELEINPHEKIKVEPSSGQGYQLDVSRSIYKYLTLEGGKPPATEVEAVLDWCAAFLMRAGMQDAIDIEIPGHTSRLRGRGVLTAPRDKRLRTRFKEIQNSPWMETFVKEVAEEYPLSRISESKTSLV